MFPKDAITDAFFMEGVATTTVYDGGNTTLLAVSMQQSGIQSETTLLCGTKEIAKNFDKNLPNIKMSYRCFDDLTLIKTGAGDDSFIVVTYVTYDIQDIYDATTTPFYINGFSYDGILIGLLLFLMFSIMFFGGFWNKIIGIKTKRSMANKFIGNNSEEGKIVYYD